MKNTKIIIVAILVGIFCSCDDFLNVAPDRDIFATKANAYKTEADFESGIMGCYKTFAQTYNDNLLIIANTMADDSYNPRVSQFDNTAYLKLFKPGQSDILIFWSLWQKSYAAVRNVNLLLNYVQTADISTDLKIKYEAEARFLRAYLYFDLVKVWGDVPLVLAPLENVNEAYSIIRTPKVDVYKQIYNDVDYAINHLTESHDPSRTNVYAARMLKARVLLYDAGATFKYDNEALSLLNGITGFELMENFSDLFNNPSKENSKESIFELQFAATTGMGTKVPSSFTNSDYIKGVPVGSVPNGMNDCAPSPKLIELMSSDDDKRKAATWEWYGKSIGKPINPANPVNIKFTFMIPSTSFVTEAGNNIILMRYADVLLLRAEINARLNPNDQTLALADLNLIRNRAGAGSLANTLTNDEVKNFIDLERFKELAFEGQRWWDLIRTGRAIAVINEFNQRPDMVSKFTPYTPSLMTEDFYVFAIPFQVIDNNPKITQNPNLN